jgi:SagB-type dehydrogenase family enzyme
VQKGIGTEFMRKTCYDLQPPSDQSRGMPAPPLEVAYDSENTLISLISPKEIHIEPFSLRESIEQRQSIRNYSSESLSLEELSWLLWTTQGIKEDLTSQVRRQVTLRNVPSAGARHAFETFLLINRVESLDLGIYRYIASKNQLLPLIIDGTIASKVKNAAYKQSMVEKCAVTFIWVADVYRMTYRYGERGYRYLHLDAGHVCQNLYLAAENINCGVCAIAAFHDAEFNNLLNLDGINQFIIYLASVGKKK